MTQPDPTPRRRSPWRLFLCLAALFFLGIGLYVWRQFYAGPPKLRVSRETTYVTEPLLPDGSPDFVGYLNREWSRGVTPENNALIPLLEAIGPGVLTAETRDRYYELLGVPMPPLEGEYLKPRYEFLKDRGLTDEKIGELEDMLPGPLVPESVPDLVAWVDANAVPLERVHAAAQRDRFYVPVTLPSQDDMLWELLLPEFQQFREVARALQVRSMLRLGAGDIDGACSDAVDALRLGRLISHSPTIIGNLVGIAIHGVGYAAAEEILLSQRMSLEQAEQFQQQLAGVPPPVGMSRIVGEGERVMLLQSLLSSRSATLLELEGPLLILHRRADRNVALPKLNAFMDDLAAAVAAPTYQERRQLLDKWSRELDAAHVRAGNSSGLIALLALGSRRRAGEHMGDFWTAMTLPAGVQAEEAQYRNSIRDDLLAAAAAIEIHRLTTGAYPDELSQLTPKLLDAVPLDPVTDRPLLYRRHPDGYLLYSVGSNGIDDGGIGVNEAKNGAYDYVIGRPLPAEDVSPEPTAE